MAKVDRSEIKIKIESKLNEFLDKIKNFEVKCDNYNKVQPYQIGFLKPANNLVKERLKFLKYLLSSYFLMEIEFELNNQIIENYSDIEEECESVNLYLKRILNCNCLNFINWESLKKKKNELNQKYNEIYATRKKCDNYFLETLPKIQEQIAKLMPFNLNKSYDVFESNDLIIKYLSSVSSIDYLSFKNKFDVSLGDAQKLNNFFNFQIQSNRPFFKEYLELNIIRLNKSCSCKYNPILLN